MPGANFTIQIEGSSLVKQKKTQKYMWDYSPIAHSNRISVRHERVRNDFFIFTPTMIAVTCLTNVAPRGSWYNCLIWLASVALSRAATEVLNRGDRKLTTYKEDARKVMFQSISVWNNLLFLVLLTQETVADLETLLGRIEFGDPANPFWVSKTIPMTAIITAVWTFGFTIDTCLRNNAHRRQPFSFALLCLEDLLRFTVPILIYNTWIHPTEPKDFPNHVAPTSNWIVVGSICMLALITSYINHRLQRREVEINRQAVKHDLQPQYGSPAVITRNFIDSFDTANILVLFFGLAVNYLLIDCDLGSAGGVNGMFYIVAAVYALVIGKSLVVNIQAEHTRQKINILEHSNQGNPLGSLFKLEEGTNGVTEPLLTRTKNNAAENTETGSLFTCFRNACC